ncbi:MAG: polysaccharide biosynthesis/export family protein, partial [candidate division KSB1 bacterium]|nr:polysaccharide biosynthesis/export family protein [candidate division KSB1 bacterium]
MIHTHQFMRITVICFSLLWLFSLVSCTIRPHSRLQPPPPPSATEPQPPPVVDAEYRLGFGDIIEVKFFNNNQFNETLAIRPDGRISMQKIGEIFVA